jgi:hypothetical protein
MHRMVLNSLGNPGYAFYTSYASFSSFDGTNWAGTGFASGNLGMSSIGGVDAAFDTLDRPVMAYTQWVNGVGGFVYVKRWNDTTGVWGTIASLSLGNTYPYQIQMELATNTRPIIAYQTGHGGSTVHVRGRNGSSWIDYGTPEEGAYAFSLALDNTKQPVLAYEKSGNGVQVLVKKWSTTSGWLPLGGALNFSSSGAKPPVVKTDINGNPVVAWQESYFNPSNPDCECNYIYVKRWNGMSWQRIGGTVTNNARQYEMDMTLDGAGNPYVIWQNNINKALYVRYWNTTESRWLLEGPNPISIVSGSRVGTNPSIAWRNNTLVASWRQPSFVINGISYNGKIQSKRFIP